MARPLEKVTRQVRRALIRDAGLKCANPGCASQRVHIHHIEYKVYSTNDGATLIAICPTCHDAVHNGELAIDDETLYRWKELRRASGRGHLYVEPASELNLLVGTVAITGSFGVRAFALTANQTLSFSVQDDDIMLIDLAITAHSGSPIVRMSKGHVRVLDQRVKYQHQPGHIRISAPLKPMYLPTWALERFRVQEPSYASDGEITLLDLEVLAPGLVRVQGIWAQDERVVLITKERLAFIWPELIQPVSMVGEGAASVLKYMGPITGALFGFGEHGKHALGALKVGRPW